MARKNRRVITKYEIWQYYDHCSGAFLLVLIVFLKLLQRARIAEENAKKSQLQAEQANAFEEDRKMALSKGMNGHIAKLIDVKNMEEVLMSVLR